MPTLITEVDLGSPGDGDSSPGSTLKAGSSTTLPPTRLAGQFQYRAVLRVEDEAFVWKGVDVPTSMPESVNLDSVMSSVADTVTFPNGARRTEYEMLFSRPESKAMMSDIFWFVFCDDFAGARRDKEEKRSEAVVAAAEESKELLFDRISNNFVDLFFSTNSGSKDAFFSRYWDSLAQVVFLTFYVAYPKSRSRFDDDFKTKLLDMCAEWTIGLRPSVPRWSHWSLDFDPISKSKARASAKRKNTLHRLNDSFGAGTGLRRRGTRGAAAHQGYSDVDRDAPRKLQRFQRVSHTLTHSPLVRRFVERRGGSSDVHFAFRVTLTEASNDSSLYSLALKFVALEWLLLWAICNVFFCVGLFGRVRTVRSQRVRLPSESQSRGVGDDLLSRL